MRRTAVIAGLGVAAIVIYVAWVRWITDWDELEPANG